MEISEIKEIDLSRYVRTGFGAMGESYDSIDNPDVMLKLYKEGYPAERVISEFTVALNVYSIGVPSPQPGELVRVGSRTGLRFRKINGKRSFSRAIADEPDRTEEFAREYAVYAKKIHALHCPEGMFPSVKKIFLNYLDADIIFSTSQQEVIRNFITSMPDIDNAVHGDLHMGNFLTTLPKGMPMTTPHEVYAIDLGDFACGTPLMDIGMMALVCIYANEEFRTSQMHVTKDITMRFWDAFISEYFFGQEKLGEFWFGEGITQDQIEDCIRPYAAVKALQVECGMNALPDNYDRLIREAFGFPEK